ncbi:MAG: hypothetical protein NWS04_04035 [Candidatus Nanopelagicales bacterium]|jgi:hypothetical protein|nr:hypothetical protein [Candidatus Nanopelagicales bacterium]
MSLKPLVGTKGHVASELPLGQNHMMRWLSTCVVAALAATLLTVPTASAKPSDGIAMPGLCRSAFNVASQRGYDVSRVASQRTMIFDGQRVRLNPEGWAADNPSDPSWTLWFHSLVWLVPLALEDPETAVKVFAERDAALPDPGASKGSRERRPIGWTQGQFRTRLETASCLYNLTRDPRLLPIAHRLAVANMDPRRYPGPPRSPVHNHGTMSNIALMQAGKAFGRQLWIDVALKRFARDLPLVFEPCGMMREQSSTYQLHNIGLWSKTAQVLGTELTDQRRALAALVRPDGVLEAIGDGQPATGLTPNGEALWCRETGWAAATVKGAHFILRFGPAIDYHGHPDHGAITWFALGTAILSDRGLFSKERTERFTFANSMAGHSVFEPVGSPGYDPRSAATRHSTTSYTVTDSGDGLTRSRDVQVRPTQLVVRDRGTGAKEWIQHWQLAPGWSPTSSGAEHRTAGLTLTVNCPRLKAVKVEAFTAWRTAVPAWDLQCRVTADKREQARQATTLTVTPSP